MPTLRASFGVLFSPSHTMNEGFRTASTWDLRPHPRPTIFLMMLLTCSFASSIEDGILRFMVYTCFQAALTCGRQAFGGFLDQEF